MHAIAQVHIPVNDLLFLNNINKENRQAYKKDSCFGPYSTYI